MSHFFTKVIPLENGVKRSVISPGRDDAQARAQIGHEDRDEAMNKTNIASSARPDRERTRPRSGAQNP